jgi:hypothetical protein
VIVEAGEAGDTTGDLSLKGCSRSATNSSDKIRRSPIVVFSSPSSNAGGNSSARGRDNDAVVPVPKTDENDNVPPIARVRESQIETPSPLPWLKEDSWAKGT